MAKYTLKLIDKIIILSGIVGILFILLFWWSLKRTNKDYYLPDHYEGWISLTYGVPGAPALEKKDGAYQVTVDENGFAETSTPMEEGWSRNQFFYKTPNGLKQLPGKVDTLDQWMIHIHRNEFYHYSHYHLLDSMPVGTDTILWDRTHIHKFAEDDILYDRGQKVIEFFYITEDPKPVTFNPPKNLNDISDKPLVEKSRQ